MVLGEDSIGRTQGRYALGTILSCLGIPYEFAEEPGGLETRTPGPCLYLLAGPIDAHLRELIGPEAPVVALDEAGGDTETRRRGDTETRGHGDTETRRQDPGLRTQDSGPITHHSSLHTAFSLLARTEEYDSAAHDEHDRFQWAHTTVRPPELAVRPLVSEYAHRLLGSLEEARARTGLPMIRKEFWPLGREMAACLTHDVDVVRRGRLPRGIAARDVTRAISSVARGRVGQAAKQAGAMARTAASGQDPYWTFDRISAIEGEHGYRSTYFFMAGRHHPLDGCYDLDHPRMAGLLRTLEESGCEIALHGSYASHGDAESLRAQKARLEGHLGKGVSGHRNHFLRFRAPDSWRAQEAAGLDYDSTLGFADREGFRGGHAFPFHPYDRDAGRTLDLLEIPLALMDVTLHKYRRLWGAEAEDAVRVVLEQTHAVKGLATLLWHNDGFYEPEHLGCGWLYEAALAWLAAKGAHVAPCEEIDRWWRAREAVRLCPLIPPSTEGSRIGWRVEAPMGIDGLVLRIQLPDPQPSLRLRGQVPVALRRDGPDYLVEFERMPAGSAIDIECS